MDRQPFIPPWLASDYCSLFSRPTAPKTKEEKRTMEEEMDDVFEGIKNALAARPTARPTALHRIRINFYAFTGKKCDTIYVNSMLEMVHVLDELLTTAKTDLNAGIKSVLYEVKITEVSSRDAITIDGDGNTWKAITGWSMETTVKISEQSYV